MPNPAHAVSLLRRLSARAAATAVLLGTLWSPGAAGAAQIIVNPSFEGVDESIYAPSLAGWTVVDQAGGSGSWFLYVHNDPSSFGSSPLSGQALPARAGAAVTDQNGAGSHVLYQDFVVPVGVSAATVSFDVFIDNTAGTFSDAGSLSYFGAPNQQMRADIMLGGATGAFSLAPADVLANLFTASADTPLDPGDPLAGFATFSADITALLQAHGGETLRLRFAEVDNQGFFVAGVDDVRLNVTVPEAATLALFGFALAGLGAVRRVGRSR